MVCCLTRDRTCSSAPIRRTHVTTICSTTRPRVTTLMRPLVAPRPPSPRTARALTREDNHAGSKPERTAAAIVALTVKARTRRSMSKIIQPGGGFSMLRSVAASQSIEKYARPMPRTAPAPAARGAERRADRQLTPAQHGAGELHVHHVHAGDEQHARAERQHRQQRPSDRERRERVDERLDEAGVELLVGVRVRLGEARGEPGELRLRLRNLHALSDQAEDVVGPLAPHKGRRARISFERTGDRTAVRVMRPLPVVAAWTRKSPRVSALRSPAPRGRVPAAAPSPAPSCR